ncbi:MAG: ABC transporter permease subunit [Chloroflexota bacterium]
MSGRAWELLAVPLRAARRAGLIWAVSIAALIVLTVAFYPSFRDSAGLDDLMAEIPEPLVDAFGLADFGTPAGFLRGNLYAVLVPLLLAVAGVLLMNGQTAVDEDSGRMEPYLAQPVTRASVFLGRVGGVLLWLLVIGVLMLAAQLISDEIFGLEIATDRIVATVVLCLLLGVLHAGVAALIAGWTGRPGVVLGIGMALAVAGYVVMALFPISDVLAPWRHVSPWDWALGGDPLTNATEVWRYLALGVPALVLIGLGAWTFGRRDVQAG